MGTRILLPLLVLAALAAGVSADEKAPELSEVDRTIERVIEVVERTRSL